MPAVLFLSSDLMFSSRLLGAARATGTTLEMAANPSDFASKITPDCRLVLIDLALDGLDLPPAIEAIRTAAPEARIIAFGAHVNESALAAAQAAGCDLVLSRGQFSKQYIELLQSAARPV
jgi:DNA-binding NarL/FixJ family response regulator